MSKRILMGVGAVTVLLVLMLLGRHSSTELPDSQSAPAQITGQNDSGSGLTFHGYDCTEDCSGHEAGYQWAEEHEINDPDDCSGNSQSFIEGCQAYAEEQGESPDDDDGNGNSNDE